LKKCLCWKIFISTVNERGENKLDILLMENVTEFHAISFAFSSI